MIVAEPAARSALLLAGLVAISGCGPATGPGEPVKTEEIACATGTATELAKVCTLERLERDGRLLMVVRQPGGGFRNFERVADERMLIPADGAIEARIALKNELADVMIDGDRYLIPVKTKD